ncbi:hypothetical protein CGLAUT_07890 [Corynebacterium glaucum]|uniref:hypothetical protein n=1 Tax=Corynebacterium glaucum TaxID=187491 RepID=UPI0025B2CE86|nr:hypothetical protein [Corynebacterium glaucum]WJZ08059.1 hypothetical protein CGLAUT_07890 [Corynebacterium glaucum]
MISQILNAIAAFIMCIVAALGLSLSAPEVGSSTSSTSSSSSSQGSSELRGVLPPLILPKSVLTPLPESAKLATPEQVDDILASQWDAQFTTVEFHPVREEDYIPRGKQATHIARFNVCNYYTVVLDIERATASYVAHGGGGTKMGCREWMHDLDEMYLDALDQSEAFYVDGPDTIYLAGPEGALKLTRSKLPAAPIQPPAEPPTDLPENVLEPLPATARKATPEELKRILTQTWKAGYSTLEFSEWDQTYPPRHPGTTHLSQLRVCNYAITELEVDLETASVTRHGGRVTDMGCQQWRHDLDDTYRKAVGTTDTFYVDGADTVYLAGPEGALKLTRTD